MIGVIFVFLPVLSLPSDGAQSMPSRAPLPKPTHTCICLTQPPALFSRKSSELCPAAMLLGIPPNPVNMPLFFHFPQRIAKRIFCFFYVQSFLLRLRSSIIMRCVSPFVLWQHPVGFERLLYLCCLEQGAFRFGIPQLGNKRPRLPRFASWLQESLLLLLL